MAFKPFGSLGAWSPGKLDTEEDGGPGDGTAGPPRPPGHQNRNPPPEADPNAPPEPPTFGDESEWASAHQAPKVQHGPRNQNWWQAEAGGEQRAFATPWTGAGGLGWAAQSGNAGGWGNPVYGMRGGNSGNKANIDPILLQELYRSWVPMSEPYYPREFIKRGG